MTARLAHNAFDAVRQLGLAMPDVEAATNWAGAPVLRVRGCFMAGLAAHASAEAGTLVVRCEIDDRERFIEDAPDTYYITDYYRPYPLVLVRLSVVGVDALRELLAVSWRMGAKKARRSGRSSERGSHARIRRPTST